MLYMKKSYRIWKNPFDPAIKQGLHELVGDVKAFVAAADALTAQDPVRPTGSSLGARNHRRSSG